MDGSHPSSERRPLESSRNLTPLEEQQLLAAHRAGDPAALTTLLRGYQHRIYAICHRMVSPHEAADLTQDVLIRVMEGLPSFDGRSRLSTWVVRVTMNCCLTWLRKQRLRRHGSLEGLELRVSEPAPGERVQRAELGAHLATALGRLEPALRAVLVLRDLHGLEYQQMADVLGTPVGTVKSRLFRARAALREAVEAMSGVESEDSPAGPQTIRRPRATAPSVHEKD